MQFSAIPGVHAFHRLSSFTLRLKTQCQNFIFLHTACMTVFFCLSVSFFQAEAQPPTHPVAHGANHYQDYLSWAQCLTGTNSQTDIGDFSKLILAAAAFISVFDICFNSPTFLQSFTITQWKGGRLAECYVRITVKRSLGCFTKILQVLDLYIVSVWNVNSRSSNSHFLSYISLSSWVPDASKIFFAVKSLTLYLRPLLSLLLTVCELQQLNTRLTAITRQTRGEIGGNLFCVFC